MSRLPRWFRTALVMIALVGVTVGGMAGSAQALPRNCSPLLRNLEEDTAKANYWAALALSAEEDKAWDEYEYYQMLYAFWVKATAADLLVASRAHCY